MIRKIGTLNFIALLLFVAMTAGLFLYSHYILGPQLKEKTLEVRRNQSEISQISNDLDALRRGIDKFLEQKEKYKSLIDLGFFNQQNRLEIKSRMNALREVSGVLTSQFSVRSVHYQKK